jgi:hypothetical protein
MRTSRPLFTLFLIVNLVLPIASLAEPDGLEAKTAQAMIQLKKQLEALSADAPTPCGAATICNVDIRVFAATGNGQAFCVAVAPELHFTVLSPTSSPAVITWTLKPEGTIDPAGLRFHETPHGLLLLNNPKGQLEKLERDSANPTKFRATNKRTDKHDKDQYAIYFPVIFYDPPGPDGKPDQQKRTLCAAADPKVVNN